MKKVILTSLVCVSVLGLAACTGNQKADTNASSKTSSTTSQSSTSSSSSSSKEDKKKQEETRKKYQEVLDRGALIMSEGAKGSDALVAAVDSQLPLGTTVKTGYENQMWKSSYSTSKGKLQYAFYDINKDGVEELLIGTPQEVNGLFSLHDDTPEFLLTGMFASAGGTQTKILILQDGTVIQSAIPGNDPEISATAYKISNGELQQQGQAGTYQEKTDQAAKDSLGLTSPAVDLTKLTWENFPSTSSSSSSSQETSQASTTTSLSSADETEIRNTIKNELGLGLNHGPNPQVLLDITNDHAGIRSYKMSEMLDYYNTYKPETYQKDDVLADLKAKSLDVPFANRSEDELLAITQEADSGWSWLYSTQDDLLFFVQKAGGGGSAPSMDIPPVSEWTVEGDTVTVPTTIEGTTTPYRTYTFKRNNKQYSGGVQKSRFYIVSEEISK